MHFTKQIIQLLNLTPEDLEINVDSAYMTKIKFYLFGGPYFWYDSRSQGKFYSKNVYHLGDPNIWVFLEESCLLLTFVLHYTVTPSYLF